VSQVRIPNNFLDSNVQNFSFRYQTEYAQYSGLEQSLDTGVIAQEIQKILPDAIKGSEKLVLPNGEVIDNFLLVNKVSVTLCLNFLITFFRHRTEF
jgi:hypothetical protein